MSRLSTVVALLPLASGFGMFPGNTWPEESPCNICPASSVKADTVAGFWCEGDEGAYIGDSLASPEETNLYLNTEVRAALAHRRAAAPRDARRPPPDGDATQLAPRHCKPIPATPPHPRHHYHQPLPHTRPHHDAFLTILQVACVSEGFAWKPYT